MMVAHTIEEVREALAMLPLPLGLVPTMGALHDGHLALVRAAYDECAAVAVSIFVNPKQFGAGEDLATYPRDEIRDLDLLDREGVDLIFAPPPEEMYRRGATTTVHVDGALTSAFEGAHRPGHFDGVATVIAKLFAITEPDVAYFGQKDAQQLALIRRVTEDLDLPVEIVGMETVRDQDGLAMSSRNARLDPEQRAAAPALYAALLAGRIAADAGAASSAEVIRAAREALAANPHAAMFAIDYLDIVDRDTFEIQESVGESSLLIAAARLGATRLIDNLPALTPPIRRTARARAEERWKK